MSVTASPVTVPIPSIEALTENAARLLQQALAEATQAQAPSGLSAADLALARSNLRALAFVVAVGIHGAYRYERDFCARMAIPILASGQGLDGWLATYLMPRKSAAVASGTASGTGIATTVLPAGALLQTDGGIQFRTTASATVSGGGTITAPIVAVAEGAAGNLAAGTALSMVSSVSGIDGAWSTAAGLSGGADLESDDDARTRLAQRLGAQPMGGSPQDYARWALAVPGITRAWGVRNPGGPGSAGVVIMADAQAPYGVPTLAQAQAVQDYIRDPRRGPPDELFVIRPTAVPVAMTIHLQPDTADIRAAVQAEFADLFRREAVPGGSIPHSHLLEVISGVVGEYNHTISSPSITSGGMFTVADFGELLVPGTITFA